MGVFLFLFCVLGYSIVGRFPTTRSNWCASSCSWPLIHRYLEDFRSDVFQLRSTNFRRPLYLTLHTIRFSALSPSTQHQPLRRLTLSRRNVQPTRQIWTPCVLIITVTHLLNRFLVVVFHHRCFVITFIFFVFSFLGSGLSWRPLRWILCSDICSASSISHPDQCSPIPFKGVVLDRVKGLCMGHAPVHH
jgi:hypothetical protein